MASKAENWALVHKHYQEGRSAEAAEACQRILKRAPNDAEALQFLAGLLFLENRHKEALVFGRRAVAVASKIPQNHNNLSAILAALERYAEALEAADKALALRPDFPQAFNNRGNALRALDRHEEALASYDKALALAPNYIEALTNRAAELVALQRPEEAVAYCDRALALLPTCADAHDTKGSALHLLGRYEEALASFDRALALKSDAARTLNNRSATLSVLKRYDEALASCDRALELRPDYDNALNNRGNALAALGRMDEAVAAFRKTLAVKPDFALAHSNLIFWQDFIAGLGFADHLAERARWFEAHGRLQASNIRHHTNPCDPERRLVVGYVSADFRKHSASSCFGPVLRHHDRTQFEIVCYSASSVEDDVTRTLREHADRWRSIVGIADEEVAGRIRADGIDILVDLSGHSAGNRLGVFTRKPAPVQVTAWGSATGTGLPTIDWLFADPVSIPDSVRPLFAERIYDLPCLITFEAPDGAPPVAERPLVAPGVVTFGSLNRVAKLTRETFLLWGRVLQALPEARLLLKDPALEEENVRTAVLKALAAQRVAAERVELRGGSSHFDHLATYECVDIALDPFPQGGGITTFEALWMGVPVVTLKGNSVSSRAPAAILTAMDLTEWIADEPDTYVKIAADRARAVASLAALRCELRSRVAASPAGNIPLYTSAVESGYRAMWSSYCRDAQRASTVPSAAVT